MSILKSKYIRFVALAGLLSTGAFASNVVRVVTLDTTALIGHPAGPFYVEFQLTDGNGAGDSNNVVTLQDIQLGGGSPSGNPFPSGGVSGDLSTGVTLTDSSFLNFFIQSFTPGTQLSFVLSATSNVDSGISPDQFSFSILDRTGAEIPTQGMQYFDVQLAIVIDSNNPAVQTFAGDSTRTPAGGGGPITMSAPTQVADITPPGTLASSTPPPNGNGWNNSNVTVSLTATDNAGGSGVQQIQYSLSGAQTQAAQIVQGTSALINITTEGTTTVTYFATDFAGNAESPHTLTIKIDKTAPALLSFQVLFGSQSYNLIGSSRNRLPWQISGIRAVFSEPVLTGSTASLSGLAATGLSGLGTNTLTWTFSPVSLGSFATVLAGTGPNALTDIAGNPLAAGAGFSQLVRVLYGDYNDDGIVNATDLAAVNAARIAPYNLFADINGDGVVNLTDVSLVRTRIGTSLP